MKNKLPAGSRPETFKKYCNVIDTISFQVPITNKKIDEIIRENKASNSIGVILRRDYLKKTNGKLQTFNENYHNAEKVAMEAIKYNIEMNKKAEARKKNGEQMRIKLITPSPPLPVLNTLMDDATAKKYVELLRAAGYTVYCTKKTIIEL